MTLTRLANKPYMHTAVCTLVVLAGQTMFKTSSLEKQATERGANYSGEDLKLCCFAHQMDGVLLSMVTLCDVVVHQRHATELCNSAWDTAV